MADQDASAREPAGVRERLREGIRGLHPAYFALVMATGIVSLAAHAMGLPAIARWLLPLNILFYGFLWLATLARLVWFRAALIEDLCDHKRGVGFFTTVAGTCVLGSQLSSIGGRPQLGAALWIAAVSLWGVLTYAVFTAITIRRQKPTLDQGIHGGWLVAVVATQSVSLLAGQVIEVFDSARELVLFVSLVMWLGGAMLYIWIIALIFYRYTFFELEPSDLSPPYWINMGAMAISTLAGTVLLGNAPRAAYLTTLEPFVLGFTLFFWATASWWIPMLVILGIWRHVYRRFPLRYDPLYWGAVFPLGMYTVCTYRLAHVIELPVLLVLPRVFVFIALGAWALAFVGLLRSLFAAPR
jgi:tellurite resistance protein TehA-like permease